MSTYIITVGTSILTNISKLTNLDYQTISLDHAKQYLANTPWEKLSAELNTLKRMKLDRNDNFFLITSDDNEGEKAAEFLKFVLEHNEFFFIFKKRIDFLTKDFSQFSSKGIKNLINSIISIIEENQNIKIIATGGYKAETAYATIIGMLFRIPVFYIHEDFRSIIEMPPMPINFDMELINKNMDKIYKILHLPKKNATKILKTIPEMLQVLFDKGEQHYNLSPTGSLIMRFQATTNLFNKDYNNFPITVYKSHSTLFGDHIRKIEDIKNDEVRKLLKKALKISHENIIKIYFDEFRPSSHEETYLLFKEIVNDNTLKYELRCKEGKQIIKFETKPESLPFTKEMIGSKLFL